MKQKNIILMVVAVGCGLVAALLTSQMSAKPKVETVDVIVAQKDLPVGTLITKDDLPKIIKPKKMPKDALPPLLVLDENDLVGKRLSRAVRMDETFNPGDLKTGGSVTIPKDKDMMSVSVGLPDAVAGFVTPGSHVDILATFSPQNSSRRIAFPLLVDMLVLAVDSNLELPKDAANFVALNTVSFAVDRDQALLLQLAKSRGVGMSLVLRHPDKDKNKDKEQWSPEDVRKLLTSGLEDRGGDSYIAGGDKTKRNPESGSIEDGKQPMDVKPATETVMIPIATADLPAGTELTVDIIKEKFTTKEVPAPAPSNAVLHLDDLKGKVLQHALAADQWLPRTFVGDYAPGKEIPKEHFTPSSKPTVEAEAPKKNVGPAKKTHNVVVAHGNGHKVFRFEEKQHGTGEWVLVGEVNASGDSAQPWTPAPIPEMKPETKPQPIPEPISPNTKQD